MEKSLTELSEDYFKAAEDLTAIIEKYRKELNEAYKKGNLLKTYDLKRKLKTFYDQRKDVLNTAYLLQHYYDDDSERSIAV